MRKIVFVICFFALLPFNALAEKSNLEKIRASVEKKEAMLKTISERQQKITTNLEIKTQQLKKLRERASNINNELDIIKKRIAKTEVEIAELEKKLEALKKISAQRLRALFLKQRDSQAAKLASFSKTDKLYRDVYFVSKFEQLERKALQQFLTTADEKKVQVEYSNTLLSDQDRLKDLLEAEELQIEKSIEDEKQLKAQLQIEKQETEKVLVSLRAEALRLETVVRSLTGDLNSGVRTVKSDVVTSHGEAATEKFVGNGLSKGHLKKPIDAVLIRAFGVKGAGFKGFLASKGQWYQAESGTEVHSVARGKVMYRGQMPALGFILIIDHGQRYYSLYGKLKDVKVQVGTIVEEGSVIANVLDKSILEPENFYFEIRKAGTSVDPKLFY